MRRPARVNPFFLVVPFVQPTADQREAQLASSLSFLERFFVRPSRQLIADHREAHNAAIPNSQITDSPYFHPHSLWSYCPGASWVSSIRNGCCRLGAELNVSVSRDARSWRDAAVTRTRRFALGPSGGNFLLLLPYVVIAQWLVHFTRYPQPMKQDP